ncbi:hypothetical protein DFQ28_007757 [Apophysomyces sp. BC1034]|nr:hypothetical protein DFQ29_006422 [Apophysomyces sp. BC1021]KAG0186449.1 hypothetical protein DFQ28_007757 [Apophysomyces sp. BC1034]
MASWKTLFLLCGPIAAAAAAATSSLESRSFPAGNSSIDSWVSSQENISFGAMLRNINPAGTVKGFVAASLSTAGPDYFYSWVRDSALVSRVVASKYNTTEAGNSTVSDILQDYATFQINIQSESTVCNCLGEPKFNPDGSSFTGPWGRPQNDGPAERASTMILIADSFLAQTKNSSYITNTLKPAVYKDLDYIVNTWSNTCFDLWEEVNGVHFYTLMVMRRGLLDGANFATRNGDASKASTYSSTASQIQTKIDSFWSSSKNYIIVTQDHQNGVQKPTGLDISTLIAANVAGLDDGFYTPGSDKILATAVAIENSMASLYPINKNLPSYLGNAIGRYPEDTYNGNGNSQGNPWFLATTAFAELYYRAIQEWQSSGVTVTSISKDFFTKFDSGASTGKKYNPGSDEFNSLAQNIALAADRFLSTVHLHRDSNGSLSEEFDRNTGYMTGARDLTWSHAALITAVQARSGIPSF